MALNNRHWKELPVLSRVQQAAMTHNLPWMRRIAYVLLSTLAIWLVFALTIGVAVGMVILLFDQVIAPVESNNDVIILSVPIIVTFIAVIGFSDHPSPTQIKPGDSLSGLIVKEARSGLIRGLFGGMAFGLIWNLAMQVGSLYIELNTMLAADFRLDEIAFYSLILGLAVAPTYAIFRAFNAVVGHLTLYLLAKDEVRSQLS